MMRTQREILTIRKQRNMLLTGIGREVFGVELDVVPDLGPLLSHLLTSVVTNEDACICKRWHCESYSPNTYTGKTTMNLNSPRIKDMVTTSIILHEITWTKFTPNNFTVSYVLNVRCEGVCSGDEIPINSLL